eukprot:415330-Amphidinium_carterae.1
METDDDSDFEIPIPTVLRSEPTSTTTTLRVYDNDEAGQMHQSEQLTTLVPRNNPTLQRRYQEQARRRKKRNVQRGVEQRRRQIANTSRRMFGLRLQGR